MKNAQKYELLAKLRVGANGHFERREGSRISKRLRSCTLYENSPVGRASVPAN
jgi:hypothetical protein